MATRSPSTDTTPPSKPDRPAPEIRIHLSWCKSCGLCVDYCSRGVLEMREGVPEVIRADRCTRCLQCEAICPDFAIEVADAEEPGEGAS